MARKMALAIFASALAALAAGCATTPQADDAASRGLSTIPWNRPAKWEGGGPLGSQLSGMRGY